MNAGEQQISKNKLELLFNFLAFLVFPEYFKF